MTNYQPIEQLLNAERDADLPLVHAVERSLSWGQWLHKVACWRQYFSACEHQRWALYHPDAGEFSAILFALWSLQRTVCLPSSCQPEVVRGMQVEVDAYVGDFAGLVVTPDAAQIYQQRLSPQAVSFDMLDIEAPLLQVYTSGSSGSPQAVTKTIAQLSSEVSHLQQLWGQSLPQAQLLATVSHQHLYGLLFRVLWPLASAWCFAAEGCEYWEQLDGQQHAQWPLLLISSPSHLTRMPQDCHQLRFVASL